MKGTFDSVHCVLIMKTNGLMLYKK